MHRRYELNAKLTEVHRRCEDLQANATRSELLLAHERESGLTASDHEKRLTVQLEAERRSKQALQQQLAAEAALRQKSDAAENAVGKELQARSREAELGAQRLQAVQGELFRAREEARQAREALADAQAAATRFERERDAEREEARKERARRQERDKSVGPTGPALPGQAMPLPSRPRASTPPSLQQHLPPPPRAGIDAAPLRERAAPLKPPPQQTLSDELARSDLWDFSSGALGRGAGPGGGAGGGFGRHPSGANLPKITKPFNTASSAGGVPALTQEEARALYGMNVPPESEL